MDQAYPVAQEALPLLVDPAFKKENKNEVANISSDRNECIFSQLYALLRTTINGRITSPGEIGYFILKTVKQQSDSLKVRNGESNEV